MYYFFFSSRRRHTRCSRDWSSDVCSSDLRDRNGGDALRRQGRLRLPAGRLQLLAGLPARPRHCVPRSEEHTSELQSRLHLVCRLLLEKKKKKERHNSTILSTKRTYLHVRLVL